jgi:hypothetical protein
MFFQCKIIWILNFVIFCLGTFEKYEPKNHKNRIVSIFFHGERPESVVFKLVFLENSEADSNKIYNLFYLSGDQYLR